MHLTFLASILERIVSFLNFILFLIFELVFYLCSIPIFKFPLLGINLLVVAARGGMETLRPALQRVYMTRASAYRDALKSFIEGYQEGIQHVMVKKEDSTAQQEEDTPKK